VLPGLGGLIVESHREHGVEGVDRGHVERNAVPVMGGFAQRLEFIMSPGILLVAVPGVQELLAYTVGHRGVLIAGWTGCSLGICGVYARGHHIYSGRAIYRRTIYR